MILSPLELFNQGYAAFGKFLGYLKPLDMSPPLFHQPLRQPLANTGGISDMSTASIDAGQSIYTEANKSAEGGGVSAFQPVTSPDVTVSKTPLQNVKASDYITPQKYLDGADIPTYYSFQMNLIPQEDQVHGMHTHLEVDRRLTLPTRTHIRFLVTASDVLHSFNVPSLCLKLDALPGRVSRIHAFILREGVFYGQCNEMCGALHGFMPVVIEAVSPEAYAAHARKFYKD